MATVDQVYQLLCDAAYQRDGVNRAWLALKQYVAEREHQTDAAEFTSVAPQNGTGAATVISTQATRVYGVMIEASGSAGFLSLYNAAAATVGVTAQHMVLPFFASTTHVYPIFCSNQDAAFGTGVTLGTSTLAATSTAIGTAVTKVTLLCDAIP